MSSQKNERGHSPWGKTSRFVYKSAAKRNSAITKEEKERFLNYGTLPQFKSTQRSEKWLQKKFPPVQTELLQEAITILNKVRDEYGTDGSFIEAAYGKRISVNRASEVIHNYLVEHGIDGMMSVNFTSELDCSGKMQWIGPLTKYNRPERRNFSMWVKTTNDNFYFRETGILNLSNHEIGTHFFRAVNDGLQPWFSNRPKFGLGPYKSQSLKDTEEGLASLNTAFESKVKYLWGPAMLYYTACMSLDMNFKELFDHLSRFIKDPEIRWKYVVRVKRGRTPTQLGGSGKDQCYFRGAVNILRNVDSINFLLLYAGKITVEDQPRVQRLARLGCIKTPYFLKDINNYRRYMKTMLKVNGIPKMKTLLLKEPDIRLTLPKTPYAKDKFNNNDVAKKSQRMLMLEARQRIVSTQLLCKSKRRLQGDSNSKKKVSSLSSQTLTIEHESGDEDDDVIPDPLDGDKESLNCESRFDDASFTVVEDDSRFVTNVYPEVFVTGRRRSDSCCASTMHSSPGKDDDLEQDSPDEDSSKSDHLGCGSAFIIQNQSQEKLNAPRKSDKNESIFPKVTPKTEIVPSCSSRVAKPPKFQPNSGLQLIREIPPPPKPNMFEIRSRALKNTPHVDIKAPRLSLHHGTPTSSPKIERNGTPNNRASSKSIPHTKKSLRKNITSFFEELIPFSKSRRKRVMPLP